MQAMKEPHLYIRKSVVEKGSRLLSPEVQEAEVRRMADRHGDEDLVVLSDIGRSGKNTRRPGYQQLLEAIRGGQVSAIYAYSLSRLNRSVRDYSDLADLCVEKGVAIRLVHEGEQDFTTPNGRFIATILAAVAQMQREIDSERQKDNIRARTANGERHGEGPYGDRPGEDVDAVVRAYGEAGSLHGAARLLDAWGVPTRRGGPWRRGVVRKIVRVTAPSVIPAGQVPRVKGAPPFRLARLLRCHCGRMMTGVVVKGHVRYRCVDTPAGHGRSSIAETHVIDAVKREAARFRVPGDVLEAVKPTRERASLQQRLDRLSKQHEMGLIDDHELRTRVRSIQEAIDRLEAASRLVDIPQAIDWEAWSPQAVNRVLRAYWLEVPLDADLMPEWPNDDSHWRLPAKFIRPRSGLTSVARA